jgi:hypothetical protein
VHFKGSYLLPVFQQEGRAAPWWVKLVRQYETNLFYLGNLFYPGDNGFYLYKDYATPECRVHILQDSYHDLEQYLVNQYGKGIFAVTDFSDHSLKPPSLAKLPGFSAFHTEPYLFLSLRDDWRSMDDMIAAMSSKYRVRYRKVMQESSSFTVRPLDGLMLKENEGLVHALYMQVAGKASFNLGFVHPSYFRETMEAAAGKFFMNGYWLGDTLVGFTSWFTGDNGQLFAHYMGMEYEYNSTYKLYNRLLADLVRAAFDSGEKEIHFGRTAVEIKCTLGALPADMVIKLKHTRGWANQLLKIPSRWSRAPEYVVRHPFK